MNCLTSSLYNLDISKKLNFNKIKEPGVLKYQQKIKEILNIDLIHRFNMTNTLMQ